MNCDCIKDIESSMSDFMKPKAGDDAKADCTATALCFGKKVRLALMIPFRIRGSKKGYTSEKGKEHSVEASYCPFCARPTNHYVVGEYEGLVATQGAHHE